MAVSGLAAIPLQKSQGFALRRPPKKIANACGFGVRLKIAGSSQRPRPQVPQPRDFAAAATTGLLVPEDLVMEFGIGFA